MRVVGDLPSFFWYIEDVELQALFPLFMNWAKTMGSSLRQELASTGLALHENRMDEVSRSIQYVAAFLCSPLLSCALPAKVGLCKCSVIAFPSRSNV